MGSETTLAPFVDICMVSLGAIVTRSAFPLLSTLGDFDGILILLLDESLRIISSTIAGFDSGSMLSFEGIIMECLPDCLTVIVTSPDDTSGPEVWLSLLEGIVMVFRFSLTIRLSLLAMGIPAGSEETLLDGIVTVALVWDSMIDDSAMPVDRKQSLLPSGVFIKEPFPSVG